MTSPEEARSSSLLLWAVDVGNWEPGADEWERCLDALGTAAGADEERARIARFRRPLRGTDDETVWLEGRANPDARSALVGRLLLVAAARALVPGTRAVPCARTPHGRPYYTGAWLQEQQMQWWCPNANVSHHGRWVVLAADTRAVVGVDVLRRECRGAAPADYVAAMARSTLTARETGQTRRWPLEVGAHTTLGPADALLDAFCTTWALKEALVKAHGEGLAFDVQRADFCFAHEHAVVEDTHGRVVRPVGAALAIEGRTQPPHRYAFRVYSPDTEHVVALCRAAPAAVAPELQNTFPTQPLTLPETLPPAPWPSLRVFPSVSDLLHEYRD